MNPQISIISPVFNEEESLSHFAKKLEIILKEYKYEVILINDGSTDKSEKEIIDIIHSNNKFKLISLSKNFGHQPALKAGLEYATGDAIIMLDSDMQHPPSLIPKMIEIWKKGFDVVQMVRDDENTKIFKKVTSRYFYKILNNLSESNITAGSADFRLLDRKIVDVLKQSTEIHLFYRGMISWYNYKTHYLKFIPANRYKGETSYTIKKMIDLSLKGITGFSIKPLRIAVYVGFLLMMVSIVYLFYVLWVRFYTNTTVEGWTSTIFVISFIGGIQILLLGIIGEYIGKIFQQVKQRPNYVISKKIGFK